MIDELNEGIAMAMYWSGLAAWRTLPIFAVVLTLDHVLRKRIPARYLSVLWMIVVARLLLPVSVSSPLALSGAADNAFETAFHFPQEPELADLEFDTFTFQDQNGETLTVRQPRVAVDATQEDWKSAHEQALVLNSESLSGSDGIYHIIDAPDDESAIDAASTALRYIIAWGWFAGFVFFACRGSIAYCRFAWLIRGQATIEDQDTVDRVLRACDRVGVGRRPKIKEAAMLDSPAVFGLFRQVICLPAEWREQLSDEQLDWVLRHELAHLRRRDSLVLFIAGVARAFHWFHPLSWIAFSKLQHSIEMAADEIATRDLPESSVRAYGNLLLQYASGNARAGRPAVVGLLAMAGSRGLRTRIEALGNGRSKHRRIALICMLPIIALIACSGLTDARTIEPSIEPPRRIPAIQVALAEVETATGQQNPVGVDSQSSARKITVNVENALRKATELQPDVDAERFVITHFAAAPFAPGQLDKVKIEDGVLTALATPRQEAMMMQRLEAFEQSGPWQIVTQTRVIETDVRWLNAFDWSAHNGETRCERIDTPPRVEDLVAWQAPFAVAEAGLHEDLIAALGIDQSASVPVRATKISRLESERLIHHCQKDPRSNLMQAPKVTMFNGQAAIISDVVQRPFVTDVSVIRGERASTVKPKISIYEDGWKFCFKTTVTAETEEVDFRCVFTHSSVGDVKVANLPRMAANQPDGEVTIQVPSVQSDSIAVESRLSADEALLILLPKPYVDGKAPERGKGQVFMIRTQLISDMDVLKDFVPADERK